jgi:hypothetical protein
MRDDSVGQNRAFRDRRMVAQTTTDGWQRCASCERNPDYICDRCAPCKVAELRVRGKIPHPETSTAKSTKGAIRI